MNRGIFDPKPGYVWSASCNAWVKGKVMLDEDYRSIHLETLRREVRNWQRKFEEAEKCWSQALKDLHKYEEEINVHSCSR